MTSFRTKLTSPSDWSRQTLRHVARRFFLGLSKVTGLASTHIPVQLYFDSKMYVLLR